MLGLQTFLSCWANEIDLAGAVSLAGDWGYDGVEGPVPSDPGDRLEVASEISTRGLPYIAEIATGGDYVPQAGWSIQQHLDDLERNLDLIGDFSPIFVNVLGGTDRWTFAESVDFHTRGMQLAAEYGRKLCWETHRSRPTFNPWVTRDLLLELPELRLTCDFSHWCAVCERLVLDEEPEILELCARSCGHFHARVGYAQGPQVPDPRDPIHVRALESHLRWWNRLAEVAEARGDEVLTASPEFGPDGYAQIAPFTQKPAADLREINQWMAQKLKSITNRQSG